jgi:hypothetical protein
MTDAVCFYCGDMKFGAFTDCPTCGVKPETDDDLALSLALTDHYLSKANLEQFSQSIQAGKPACLDDDVREKFLHNLAEFRKTKLGQLTIGAPR